MRDGERGHGESARFARDSDTMGSLKNEEFMNGVVGILGAQHVSAWRTVKRGGANMARSRTRMIAHAARRFLHSS